MLAQVTLGLEPRGRRDPFGLTLEERMATKRASSAKTGTIPNIRHFVVLMLENRSFDHLFGFRPGLGKEGLSGSEYNLLKPEQPESSDNARFYVTQNAPWKASGEGPSHSITGTNLQLSGSRRGPAKKGDVTLTGFVEDYALALRTARTNRVAEPISEQLGEVMASFAPGALPSINALVDNFCLCTHWHSEVPGPTQPNRLYMHAATSMGLTHNVWSRHFTCKTIYENLQDAGRTWSVYEIGKSSKYDEVREFSNINKQDANFRQFEHDFEGDMKAGTFPNYSFIVPRYVSDAEGPANSQHAPDDIRYGDNLIADVYEALRRNEEVWRHTVLIVTYDEHGGFFDHVVPPMDAVFNPDGIDAPLPDDPDFVPVFKFDRLGLRVPAVIVSPWVAAGSLCDIPLRHTSVLATVKKIFGLPSFLTQRDATANAFDSLLLSEPRNDAPMKLPRAQADAFKREDARHPSRQPLDESRLQMASGIARRGKANWYTDEPATHGEAAKLIAKVLGPRK
jgi:phospholipase C